MKKLIVLAVLSVLGLQAQAKPKGISQAQLNKFYFQAGSPLAQRDISYGHVTVDRYNRTITLDLQPAFHCPAGAMCAMVMPQPVRLELPGLQIKKGGCGETIYIAEKNLMPADGLRQRIEVIDNTHNYCEMYPLIPTIVHFDEESLRPYLLEQHVMHGSEYLQ